MKKYRLTRLEAGLIIGAVIAGILISILIISRISTGIDEVETEYPVEEATPVQEVQGIFPRAEAKEIQAEIADVTESVSGKASYYNRTICPLHETTYQVDCFTRNGEMFDDQAMIAACPHDLLGKKIEVLHKSKSITVTCTDTGSFTQKYGRVLDLSEGAFSKLAPTSEGVIEVKYQEVS